MKKFFKVFGIILAVIILVLIIYIFSINFYGGLNKDNPMSRKEVVKLLEKGKEYPNYYYSSEYDGIIGYFIEKKDNNKTETFVKDGIEKKVVNGKISDWKNYDENIMIHMMGEKYGKSYANISYIDENENENNQMGFDYSLITDEKTYNFEYMGSKEYEGRETIFVKVWNKGDLKIYSTIFYIDKESGLIMRRIDYSGMFGIIKMDCNRNVKIDSVTDENIEEPNLDDYEVTDLTGN